MGRGTTADETAGLIEVNKGTTNNSKNRTKSRKNSDKDTVVDFHFREEKLGAAPKEACMPLSNGSIMHNNILIWPLTKESHWAGIASKAAV